jgi:hypothetical protein
VIGSATASGTSVNATVSTAIAASGASDYSVRLDDSAGNESDCAASVISYNYDPSAVTVTLLSTGLIKQSSLFTGWDWDCNKTGPVTCEYRVTVTDGVDSHTFGISDAYDDPSIVTLTDFFPTPTDGHTYYLHVQPKDSAGNIGVVFSYSVTIDNTAPLVPSLALAGSLISPGADTTPAITVSGVNVGDTVSLFTTSDCTGSAKASATISSGTSVNLENTGGQAKGTTTYYAKVVDRALNATCSGTSSTSIAYESTKVSFKVELKPLFEYPLTGAQNNPFATSDSTKTANNSACVFCHSPAGSGGSQTSAVVCGATAGSSESTCFGRTSMTTPSGSTANGSSLTHDSSKLLAGNGTSSTDTSFPKGSGGSGAPGLMAGTTSFANGPNPSAYGYLFDCSKVYYLLGISESKTTTSTSANDSYLMARLRGLKSDGVTSQTIMPAYKTHATSAGDRDARRNPIMWTSTQRDLLSSWYTEGGDCSN